MSDRLPFITEAGADTIKRLIRRASATVQRLQDPAATVQFTREGVAVTGNVMLIEIAIDDRDQLQAGQGAIEESTLGTAVAWADDVDAVRMDDRFSWDGRVCVLTSPPFPEQYDTVTMRFRMLGDRPV